MIILEGYDMSPQPSVFTPTVTSSSGNNPQNAALNAMTTSSTNQANANKLLSGGLNKSRRNKSRRINQRQYGIGGAIAVPQMHLPYKADPTTNPNTILTSNNATHTQSQVNAEGDKYATQMGGSRRSRRRKGSRRSMRRRSMRRKGSRKSMRR